MTVGELYQWAAVRNWGPRRIQKLELHLLKLTILPVDLMCCRHWAQIRAARLQSGNPISPQDAWIAATALRYGISLVTHDPNDYAGITGLEIITELE